MREFPTVLHAVAGNAKVVPDKIAVIEAETDRKCAFAELWTYVKAFSKRLAVEGVKRDFGDGYGTRVVVRCTQTIDFVVASLAVQLAGGVFVPVERNIADARIVEIMRETDSFIFIAAAPLADYDCTYIPLSAATAERNDDEDENYILPGNADALALILFTTGTTGKSKGVMHSYNSSAARVVSHRYFEKTEQTWLIASPLSHTNGLNRVYYNLFYRCTAVLLNGYSFPKFFFDAVIKYNVTVISLLAAATNVYLNTSRDKLEQISKQIQYINLGASTFSENQISELRDIFPHCNLVQFYGATEVNGCYVDHSLQRYAQFCVGQPLKDARVVFYDEQKQKVVNATKDAPGLFAFKSGVRMMGYWKNPELTANVTRGEYIILSDLGYRGDDGLLYFLSRADDVIVSGGYKIAPLEVEEVANAFEGIRDSACVPVSDPVMGQVPKLYVAMQGGYDFDYRAIYTYLQGRLEAARLPRFIEEIDVIPRINNKINRRELAGG